MGKDRQISKHVTFQIVLSAMKNKRCAAKEKDLFRRINREGLTDEMIFVPRPEWYLCQDK